MQKDRTQVIEEENTVSIFLENYGKDIPFINMAADMKEKSYNCVMLCVHRSIIHRDVRKFYMVSHAFK